MRASWSRPGIHQSSDLPDRESIHFCLKLLGSQSIEKEVRPLESINGVVGREMKGTVRRTYAGGNRNRTNYPAGAC